MLLSKKNSLVLHSGIQLSVVKGGRGWSLKQDVDAAAWVSA